MKASNVKAMRDACQKMRDLLMLRGDGKARCVLTWDEFNESQKMLRAALAATPRNCDIHTDFNDAITTLANKRNWHDGKWNSERYCILANWLLAPATEQKGECDGSK